MSRTKRLILATVTAGLLLAIGGATGVTTGGAAVAETSRCFQVHICVID